MDLGIAGLRDASPVGRGSSSRVYRAWQPEYHRWVAAKVITDPVDEGVLRRFERERRALASLSGHDGIVVVHQSGTTRHGDPYFLMPFYELGSLEAVITDAGPQPWREATGWMAQVAHTLADAHAQGILHGDLKPTNVLRALHDRLVIADFGLAPVDFEAGAAPSSPVALAPAYRPPEAFHRHEPTPAGDIYSVGATWWALLAGRPPFVEVGEEPTLFTLARRISDDPVGDLRGLAPEPVCGTIEWAMHKEAGARPATMAELAERIDGLLADEALPAWIGPVRPTATSAIDGAAVPSNAWASATNTADWASAANAVRLATGAGLAVGTVGAFAAFGPLAEAVATVAARAEPSSEVVAAAVPAGAVALRAVPDAHHGAGPPVVLTDPAARRWRRGVAAAAAATAAAAAAVLLVLALADGSGDDDGVVLASSPVETTLANRPADGGEPRPAAASTTAAPASVVPTSGTDVTSPSSDTTVVSGPPDGPLTRLTTLTTLTRLTTLTTLGAVVADEAPETTDGFSVLGTSVTAPGADDPPATTPSAGPAPTQGPGPTADAGPGPTAPPTTVPPAPPTPVAIQAPLGQATGTTTATVGFTTDVCAVAQYGYVATNGTDSGSYASAGYPATGACTTDHLVLLGTWTPPLLPATQYSVTIHVIAQNGTVADATVSFTTPTPPLVTIQGTGVTVTTVTGDGTQASTSLPSSTP